MTELKTEALPDFVIHESDFSEFVAEGYGRPFCWQQMVLAGQDSFHEFDIFPPVGGDEDWVSTYAQPQLDEWLAAWANMPEGEPWLMKMNAERDHVIDLNVLTWDLHRRGLLAAGTYLMKVGW